MRSLICIIGILAATLGPALPVAAQSAAKAENPAPMAKALESAMTPGEGQKRLNPLIGTFNVAIKIWVTPEGPPVESTAASVNSWVLGGRYVQMMLNGDAPNALFSGTGNIAYDNVAKNYQAAWMDTGSTGITLYTGNFGASPFSIICTNRPPSTQVLTLAAVDSMGGPSGVTHILIATLNVPIRGSSLLCPWPGVMAFSSALAMGA